MAYTQSQLEALQAALASGTLRVQYEDRMITYRDLDEIWQAIQIVQGELAGQAGTVPRPPAATRSSARGELRPLRAPDRFLRWQAVDVWHRLCARHPLGNSWADYRVVGAVALMGIVRHDGNNIFDGVHYPSKPEFRHSGTQGNAS